MRETFNILLSSAGRRVELLDILEQTLLYCDLDGYVLATDAQAFAPAFLKAKARALVPKANADNFIERNLELCRQHQIRLLIPTIDTELAVWAEARPQFLAEGIEVMISSPETVAIAADKRATHAWFCKENFPCCRQASRDEALGDSTWRYPCFAKPSRGSRSIDAQRIASARALAELDPSVDWVVESLAQGFEITLDAYVSPRTGSCGCVVPRKRLEVRAGEVSKAMTLDLPALEEATARVVEKLPGARGSLCVQAFYEPAREQFQFIEINPRFGGGYPLTQAAGAHFARWYIEDCLDLPSTLHRDWLRDLMMLRYDQSVFVRA